MKTLRLKGILSMLILIAGSIAAVGQKNRIEVPGDNFSLEGALELFKKSASPQEFEQLLNSSDARVNNLDLNGDGQIDYIRVIDRNQGNVHVFILQAIVSDTESQDVAVIELEKLSNGKAILQITGDEDIYGIETIIEPTEEVRVNAGASTARSTVNVWAWPSVQYVYSPYYQVWVSPWGWYMRPVWWRPWRPIAYYDYYPYWYSYRPYYAVCHTHRIVYAQQIYRPCRTTSVIVYHRHRSNIERYRTADVNHQRKMRGRHEDVQSFDRDRDVTYQTPTRDRERSSYKSKNTNKDYSVQRVESSGRKSRSEVNSQPRESKRSSNSVQREGKESSGSRSVERSGKSESSGKSSGYKKRD